MEHKTIYELIAEYSNGTLSPAAREQLRHLIDNDREARKYPGSRETTKNNTGTRKTFTARSLGKLLRNINTHSPEEQTPAPDYRNCYCSLCRFNPALYIPGYTIDVCPGATSCSNSNRTRQRESCTQLRQRRNCQPNLLGIFPHRGSRRFDYCKRLSGRITI